MTIIATDLAISRYYQQQILLKLPQLKTYTNCKTNTFQQIESNPIFDNMHINSKVNMQLYQLWKLFSFWITNSTHWQMTIAIPPCLHILTNFSVSIFRCNRKTTENKNRKQQERNFISFIHYYKPIASQAKKNAFASCFRPSLKNPPSLKFL